MKGKLIIIEAGDGSGKSTQSNKLYNRLALEKHDIKKVEFPDYKSQSSALIKMYLNGDFGSNPGDVSPYVASIFYTVDRYASFKKEWEEFYNNGGIVLSDRYTTSNMIHQASKIVKNHEKKEYLDWLWHIEFEVFGLPKPDCVIFLDMPPQYSKELMKERLNKYTGRKEKDIHEKNYDYIVDTYHNACQIADLYGWEKIQCVSNKKIRDIEEIHEDIYRAVNQLLI